MDKKTIISQLLSGKKLTPQKDIGKAFAPSNIALCKYWGKRDNELNLPVTSSLSISLANKGVKATITPIESNQHEFMMQKKLLDPNIDYLQSLQQFLQHFCFNKNAYRLEFDLNIPVAAGLASSASIYAALIKGLNDLYQWQLDAQTLSILARLGSGSACRSVYQGFVEWQRGELADGMDSYAIQLPIQWPALRVGLCIVNHKPKAVSSRAGMQRTVETSSLYSAWPKKCEQDLQQLKIAIETKNFPLLGKTAESNALAMHATMLTAWPPLQYATPQTITLMHQIWGLRQQGVELYFTQDAGPNLKLLFLEEDESLILDSFPEIEIIRPFNNIIC